MSNTRCRQIKRFQKAWIQIRLQFSWHFYFRKFRACGRDEKAFAAVMLFSQIGLFAPFLATTHLI
jgi:hypothetical protein